MLRPIDMTLTIQNAAEAHRANINTNAARPEVAQQQFADRMEKQVREQEQQVKKSDQSERSDVNPDRQGHGGGYQPRRKPAAKKESSVKAERKATGESLYDIRI